MKGPVLHSNEWKYVGECYPWYVFKPRKKTKSVPELRYLSCCHYLDDNTGEKKHFKRKLPDDSGYVTEF